MTQGAFSIVTLSTTAVTGCLEDAGCLCIKSVLSDKIY